MIISLLFSFLNVKYVNPMIPIQILLPTQCRHLPNIFCVDYLLSSFFFHFLPMSQFNHVGVSYRFVPPIISVIWTKLKITYHNELCHGYIILVPHIPTIFFRDSSTLSGLTENVFPSVMLFCAFLISRQKWLSIVGFFV